MKFRWHRLVQVCMAWGMVISAMAPDRVTAVEIVDFEDYLLAPESHFSGPDPGGINIPGDFGTTVRVGSFTSGGVEFVNRYNLDFGSWSSFAVSNETDTTTPGFGNQYSAFPGGGAGRGADNYGVAFGYDDLLPNQFDLIPFDPLNVSHLQALPTLMLPPGFQAVSALVTNVTYAALSMLNGDAFAKQFGGPTGNDPDWFKLSVFGIDENNQPLGTEVELYLADYRFADNSLDYLLDDWTFLDLSPLVSARSLHFNLSSSDRGDFGMNTPSSFAIDNLTLEAVPTAVPEPGSFLLLGACGLFGGGLIRRRRSSQDGRRNVDSESRRLQNSSAREVDPCGGPRPPHWSRTVVAPETEKVQFRDDAIGDNFGSAGQRRGVRSRQFSAGTARMERFTLCDQRSNL
ncbi:MAG: DUF4465 domain-containing protein [Planctomycetaceae bacterium]|nr:DUF4465 domain-containing protein [Planctomycetaceae bacterium]